MQVSFIRVFPIFGSNNFLALLLLLSPLFGEAKTLSDSTIIEKKIIVEKPEENNSTNLRNFDGLDIPSNTSTFDPIIIPNQLLSDSIQYHRSKALEYEQQVTRNNAFVNTLNGISLLKLPVGLQRQIGSIAYTIIISRLNVTSAGSVIEAYFMFEIPQTGDKIAFRGSNISISNNGGFTGTGRLELIGSYPIALSSKTLLTIIGKGNTFVEFDCSGFKGMGIDGEIEFSRDLLIPEDDKGKQKAAPERVKTKFLTTAQSWSDLLLGITIPAFQVNGLKDISFSVKNAFLDLSDLANPSGMQFPQDYTSPFLETGQAALWQGFYLQRLDVKLPKSFTKNRGDSTRIILGVENMILDDQGFTGKIFAENVLTTGDMNGWAYSIDRVGLELVINQVKGFDLAGTISVPRIKAKNNETATHFGYVAQRGADGNYIFAVKVENNLRLPFLLADINLYPGSSVIVKEKDNKFYPSAILNGDLTIKSVVKGVKANFNQIRFEGMLISSQEPYFDIQTLGFGGSEGQSVSKFPVVIRNISIKKETNKLGIGFELTINVGGKSQDEGFGGAAWLTVWSENKVKPKLDAEGKEIGKEGDWQFKTIELSGVEINIKKPNAYELAGTILFFEGDPIYGEGFRGKLKGSISKFGGIETTALFGRTEKFTYWYADGLIKLSVGVPLVPGALFATGFAGGFFYKMKQTDKSPGTSIGEAKSGIYYVPDENTLGIKAIMTIGTLRPQAMNGDVGLEVAMNRHGGINSVTLAGNANFMSLADLAESKMKELAGAGAAGKLSEKLAALTKGQVFGSMKLMFDNENDVFHGNLEVFINVAGGLVRGIGEKSKAGWAVLHFEKTDWYVLIGTPDQPLGIEVAKIFKSKSYFMLGKHLPGSPPPPSQVTEILGGVDLDYMRDFNALESGTGFAFGLHFLVDTGDLKFLMFYGRFAAGTGVDFMLKDYGNNYHCAGSSGAMGINGWYANGQAYAFVMGKIGIKVKLRFYKGDFDILSIGAAAILQTKGPNPFWMKGTVGGYYRILGGLVKGSCKFEVTVGQDCKPVGDQDLLADVNLITEIGPKEGSTQVDVFNTPQAAFSIPLGQEFAVTDAENKKHLFRANLKEFTLHQGPTALKGNVKWNSESDVAVFDAADILYPQKDHKVKVVVAFEEKIGGKWTTATFDGKPSEEKVEQKFKTGDAPDYIIPSNIQYAYPLSGQYNFYPAEYPQGFIQLKKGQPYLFQSGSKVTQKARFTDVSGGQPLDYDFKYDNSTRKVSFSIPSQLSNEKVYKVELINIQGNTSGALDKNVKRTEKVLQDDSGGEVKLTTKSLEGDISLAETKSMYSAAFRTSRYKTFGEKLDAFNLSNTFTTNTAVNVLRLSAYLRQGEYFDKFEMDGIPGVSPMMQFEADLVGNFWYEQKVRPLVYDSLPLRQYITVSRRDYEVLGLPPIRDINIYQDWSGVLDEDGTITASGGSGLTKINYSIMPAMYADYQDIQNQVAIVVIDKPGTASPHELDLLLKRFPVLTPGNYKIIMRYTIPGVSQPTTIRLWQLTPDLRR